MKQLKYTLISLLVGLVAFPLVGYAASLTWYTNGNGRAAIKLTGANTNLNWTIKGKKIIGTNALNGAVGGGSLTDPSTNAALTGYWMASTKSGEADGATIASFADTKNSLSLINVVNPPTKQTVSGKTVIRFDGVNDTLLAQGISINNLLGTNQGTIILNVKLNSGNAASMFMTTYWTGGGDVLTTWYPYQTDIYFDFGTTANGRITVANPGSMFTGHHTLIYRRYTNGDQSIRLDGVNVATGTGKTATLASGATGDFVLGSSGSNYYAPMDFVGMATYNTALDDATADSDANWIATYAP